MADPVDVLENALEAQPDSAPGAVTPCPFKDKRPAKAPPKKNPCKGLGMSDEKKEKAFADEAKKLRKDWKGLTVDERQARIKALANSALAPGVPEVGIHPWKDSDAAGQMSFPDWRLDLGDKELAKNNMTNAEANEFADTIYHETRHSEQWFLMPQKRAAEGQTAEQIHHDLQIPRNVAEAAKKDPLGKDDPRQACADALYESVYGKNGDHRAKVLTELETKSKAEDQLEKKYEDIAKDPSSSKAKTDRAYKTYLDAHAESEKASNDYVNLPEEVDAWETAGAMKKKL